MSWILHDPDEWEAKSESTIYGRDPFGNVLGTRETTHVSWH